MKGSYGDGWGWLAILFFVGVTGVIFAKIGPSHHSKYADDIRRNYRASSLGN